MIRPEPLHGPCLFSLSRVAGEGRGEGAFASAPSPSRACAGPSLSREAGEGNGVCRQSGEDGQGHLPYANSRATLSDQLLRNRVSPPTVIVTSELCAKPPASLVVRQVASMRMSWRWCGGR